ncbi:DUF4406 domain-containing protein [Actinomyces lilanjuaniae]|uniref:DUF4406 domain-containing protein n=1 Tax=Actinomyces lilanjuaniae TaxID=2321394 RepID=A0ABM6Z3S9_9ACTO|nr:DUF4406 domain-containing protein [Actinomyces lilanjuaniae]AYD89693.1 DUF4406 domain-containing protein [Actinomyces lilanjuaniae]
MRLYVAGPVTGVEDDQAAFASAAARLRAAGYDVCDPAGLARPDGRAQDSEWVAWMRTTTRMLTICDGVALLPGWERSRGAVVEADWARAVGLPVRGLEEWL